MFNFSLIMYIPYIVIDIAALLINVINIAALLINVNKNIVDNSQ